MTDFFADLEQEIRNAHPRRSRPVVPVRGLAATAAVAVTLVAVVLGIGALSPTTEEVATRPTPDPQPTAVTPVDCNGLVVDGRIPDAVVDRFAILRGEPTGVDLQLRDVPGMAAQVIRQSLRAIEGPEGREYVFAIVRLADMDCNPSELGVCLIAPSDSFCTVLEERPLLGHVVDDLPGDRSAVAIVADDDVPRVTVSTDRRGVTGEIDLEANTGFQLVPDDSEDVEVTPADPGGEEIIPLNCSTAPAMSGLKERLGIFRRPADEAPHGFDVNLPKGWHRLFLTQVREVDGHYVFPANNATCDTGLCLVAADDPTASCELLQDGPMVLILVRGRGEGRRIAGLVRDGVDAVEFTSGGRKERVAVRDNLYTYVTPSDDFEVIPAS